ncbi:MAG: hypothetical protein JWM15_3717 [Cryptosporangiaceae bacterium]|jgi:hypothetical protein|nr:hypothetical protein [Cryptosporangiaceae bacterium]
MLGLGVLACGAGQPGRDVPRAYTVAASLLGAVALVAGITAVVNGSAAMLATLLAAMVALWVLASVRRAAALHRPAAS